MDDLSMTIETPGGTNIAAFTREFPERAVWWEGMEALAPDSSARTAARWSKQYTRAELCEFMCRLGDWALRTEGALCQADGGECFA